MTSAYAVFNSSYELRTPYISTDEYAAAPTAMDTSNLVPGGPAQQLIALQETIGRASSWIDQYTCGAWGTLCCTNEVENGRIWGSYRNTLPVNTKYWPIVEVSAFTYSPLPGGLVSSGGASVNPSQSITIYPQQFEVAATGTVPFGLGPSGGIAKGVQYDCTWQYVCGWVNTALAASVDVGGTSITPTSLTGIYPGGTFTLYDLPNDEGLQVSASYVPGTTPVPLVAPVQYYHEPGATLANIPPAIKQAAILATTAFIKQRGSGALIVEDMGAVTHQSTGFSQNAGDDWFQAMDLLRAYRQMFIG